MGRVMDTLRVLRRHLKDVTSDQSTFDYYKTHRYNGVPIERKNDSVYLDWHYNYRTQIKKYYNIHKGEDCFIIGNGPSLNKMDLAPLNKYVLFGQNKIHMIFEKCRLNLSYHVAVNPLVIEQMQDVIASSSLGCPSFLSASSSRMFSQANTNVFKLHMDGPWTFSKDLSIPISEGFTVTFVSMQIAFYMGFRNVFLIGVDHNFKQAGKPNEKQEFKGEDINHFHPDYFKGQQWHLADVEGNDASYALAKHQFHSDGREIFDATVDGKLTLFEKVSFEEALKMAKPKK